MHELYWHCHDLDHIRNRVILRLDRHVPDNIEPVHATRWRVVRPSGVQDCRFWRDHCWWEVEKCINDSRRAWTKFNPERLDGQCWQTDQKEEIEVKESKPGQSQARNQPYEVGKVWWSQATGNGEPWSPIPEKLYAVVSRDHPPSSLNQDAIETITTTTEVDDDDVAERV